MDSEYVSTSIPRGLWKRAQQIVDDGRLGYRTPTEVIVEGARQKIDILEEKKRLLEVKPRA